MENQFITSKVKQVSELFGVKLKSYETSFISFKISSILISQHFLLLKLDLYIVILGQNIKVFIN